MTDPIHEAELKLARAEARVEALEEARRVRPAASKPDRPPRAAGHLTPLDWSSTSDPTPKEND